jgi:hypothetical protein
MASGTLDFAGAVAHVAALVGTETGVVVMGRDRHGDGVVAELTGTLRALGSDPDRSGPEPPGVPASFGFEGQDNAFYLDPDAFVEAWSAGRFLRVELTFGSLEVSGPIQRPDWF